MTKRKKSFLRFLVEFWFCNGSIGVIDCQSNCICLGESELGRHKENCEGVLMTYVRLSSIDCVYFFKIYTVVHCTYTHVATYDQQADATCSVLLPDISRHMHLNIGEINDIFLEKFVRSHFIRRDTTFVHQMASI